MLISLGTRFARLNYMEKIVRDPNNEFYLLIGLFRRTLDVGMIFVPWSILQ